MLVALANIFADAANANAAAAKSAKDSNGDGGDGRPPRRPLVDYESTDDEDESSEGESSDGKLSDDEQMGEAAESNGQVGGGPTMRPKGKKHPFRSEGKSPHQSSYIVISHFTRHLLRSTLTCCHGQPVLPS